MIDIDDALRSLRPNSRWMVIDGDYDQIEWWDDENPIPTREEVEAEIARLTGLYDAKEYQRLRAAEYPDFKEYLDGIVKGDDAQVQAYIDACLAVKAKYPKP